MIFPLKKRPKSIKEQLMLNNVLKDNEDLSIKFEQIGEIAVTKLDPNDTNLSLRKKIGRLILDQSPKMKSVYNKIDIVNGIERIYPIEHLAGARIPRTWHQEYSVKIYVDIENAYFNPRLAEEHHRLATLISPNEVILDLFAGVGPFALHCTKEQKCKVVAVDINQIAIEALAKSMKSNRLRGEICPIVADSTQIFRKQKKFDRIILNIPNKSIIYLKYAVQLLKKGGVINMYQFVEKTKDPISAIQELLKDQLSYLKSYKELQVKIGRDVSPSRVQMNVDLRID